MKQRLLVVALAASFVLAVGVAIAVASPGTPPPPTGQRTHAQNTLEPVFNAENFGEIGYISTPNGTKQPVPSNPKSWSPIYVVEYPGTSTINTGGSGASGPLNCQHKPSENCPTHGNDIAGLAQNCPAAIPGCSQAVRNVYTAAGGPLGHDHVMDFPGGADWNVAWEPVVVLFTNAAAANTRLLTDQQIEAAVDAGNAIEIPNPAKTFHCQKVSDSVWALTSPFQG